jgi:hypothetical protein
VMEVDTVCVMEVDTVCVMEVDTVCKGDQPTKRVSGEELQ